MEVLIKPEKLKEKDRNQKTVRFSDAHWYSPGIEVLIGGVGSIGSHLAYYLGRQECELYIYDMDLVSEVNIGGQLYPVNKLLEKKTQITKEMVKLLSDNTNVHTFDRFTEDSMASEYMFSCFDNMVARKVFFESWCKVDSKDKIFIDGRMNFQQGQVFVVTHDRIEDYKKELFNDSEVKDAQCTMKSTTFCGSLVAALMTAVFNNYMGNKLSGIPLGDYPFKTDYNLQTFKFDTYE